MLVRLTLVMMLCGSGALMASGVRVLVQRIPIERVMQKFRLQDFPAQALKRDTQLVPSAAAFVDELLQASCQSCFAEIFAEKNFQHYRIVEQLDDEYVEAYARKLSYHSLFPSSFPPSSFPDYDVTVSYTDEATLTASLLDKFAELDSFYQAMHAARQQIDANMPVDGVRRDVFAAQQEKYTELYQHTRDEIDAVLADLRGLLDEHGREYPHEILASVDNLETHLRSLTQARDAWSRNIDTAVTDHVTPRMEGLQRRGEDLYAQEIHEQKMARQQEKHKQKMHEQIHEQKMARQQEKHEQKMAMLQLQAEIRQPSKADTSYTTHKPSGGLHDEQHQDTMTAVVAIDPLDIF